MLYAILEGFRLLGEGRGKQEETMRAVTVYRVDYARKTRYSVGVVLEQRKKERGNNYNDLLRLARKLFALDTADSVHIVIDASQARGATLPNRRGSSEKPYSFRRLLAESR